MDKRIRIGSGLNRFLHQLVTLLADGRMERAGTLLSDLGRAGALTTGAASYQVLDLDCARRTIPEWLRPHEISRFNSEIPAPVGSLLQTLLIWDRADVPLPCEVREARAAESFSQLARLGLVVPSPSGWRLSMLLRLMLWCGHGTPARDEHPDHLSLLFDGVRALRRSGRWIQAGRLAHEIIQAAPEQAASRFGLRITAVMGRAHLQDYQTALRILDDDAGPQARRFCWPAKWSTRITALRAFMTAETGDLTTASTLLRSTGREDTRSRERFWMVRVGCWVRIRQGEYRRSERLLARLLRRRSPQVAWVDTVMLNWRASALLSPERYQEAAALYQDALQAAAAAGWQDRAFNLLFNSALGKIDTGQYDQAERQLRGFITRCEREGSLHLLPGAWAEMARISDHVPGRPPARWALEKALSMAEHTGTLPSAQFIVWGLANRASDRNRLDDAQQYLNRLAELSRRVGQPYLEGVAKWELSRVFWVRGCQDEAFELLNDSLQIQMRLGQLTRAAAVWRRRAQFLLELERLTEAEQASIEADTLYRRVPGSRDEMFVDLLRLELAIRRGNDNLTEADLDSIRLDRAGGSRYLAYAYALLAIGFACLDDWLTARPYARETLSYLSQLGYEYFAGRVLDLAHRVKNRSRAARELVSYWQETLPYSNP